MATEAEKNEAKRQFELANPDGPGMSVNVGGYGNLIFKNNSVYDAWKNDPQSMTYSQGPRGVKYVEPKAADYETRFNDASGGGAKARDEELNAGASAMKRGGKVKKMASGGMASKASTASRRADGIATRGKTRGKMY
jgi:hypothetical protein